MVILSKKNVKILDKKKHNGIISFWKFCFCLMIIIYHARLFADKNDYILLPLGSIGVEFFFIVSGYFMAKKALNTANDSNSLGKETISFILVKIKSLLPYVLFSGLLSLIFLNIYTNMNTYENISSIWDLLLLKMVGLKGTQVNGPVWYLSSMLLCMFILYPLIRKYKKEFIYIIIPLIILLGSGIINQNVSNFRNPNDWLGFTFLGNIRALIELSIGSAIYVICEKIKNTEFTIIGKISITIIEIFGFITPFIVSQFIASKKYDFIIILILSISILLAFTEKTLEYNILSNKFSYWLEKISLPLYIFNHPIRIFMLNSSLFSNINYYQKTLIFIIITFVVSIISMYIIEYLKKKNYYLKTIKKVFIK